MNTGPGITGCSGKQLLTGGDAFEIREYSSDVFDAVGLSCMGYRHKDRTNYQQQDGYSITYDSVLGVDGHNDNGHLVGRLVLEKHQEILKPIGLGMEAPEQLEQIFSESREEAKAIEKGGACCSAVLMNMVTSQVHIRSAGDTRIIHFSGNEIIYQTKDQTLLRELKEGEIPAHIKAYRKIYNDHESTDQQVREYLDNAVQNSITGDKEGNKDRRPDINESFPYAPGQTFWIVSDGVTGNLTEENMLAFHSTHKTNIRNCAEAVGTRILEKQLQEASLRGKQLVKRDNFFIVVIKTKE